MSARFTEWMQGWPDGWVTDVPGVSRNEALKLCGNGVVPQQGAEALRRLLEVEGGVSTQEAGVLLPTPKAGTNRASRHAMVEIRQWSAPSLEQAVEIAQGILPREFRSWDEVPGRSGGAA